MKKMRILFVCLGNICRSPMAEFTMKNMVRGREAEFEIASDGTESYNIGRPVNPPAARELSRHGIGCTGFAARQLRREDFLHYDLLIGMDGENIRDMERLGGRDGRKKIRRMMDFTARPGDVDDPWYTGDYATAWRDIEEGCRGLLAWLDSGTLTER